MTKRPKNLRDRTAELEDELKQRDARIRGLRADLADVAPDDRLVERGCRSTLGRAAGLKAAKGLR